MENHDDQDRIVLLNCLQELKSSLDAAPILFSDDSLPPGPAATCLGVTRLHAIMGGSKKITTAINGTETDVMLESNQWLYTTPFGWTKADWRYAQKTFAVVFHHGFVRYLYFEHDGTFDRHKHYIQPDHIFHTAQPLRMDGVNLLRSLDDIGRNRHRNDETVHLLMGALLNILIDELSQSTLDPSVVSRAQWQRLLDFMEEHAAEPIDRNTVADWFGIHPNSISRLFKQFDTQSFQGRLNRYRLERSCRVLGDRSLTLESVASQCGFANANYFIKAFRKSYGYTPGEYRRRLDDIPS